MVYCQITDNSFKRDVFRGENIMLSTSTSNSSFLNANATGDYAESDDRIQILDCETTRTYEEPMSQTRKLCFIASIVGTVLVIFTFLLLPCKSNCVANTEFIRIRNWVKNYEKMEFKGDINTVLQQSPSVSKNLVFMYRSDKIFPDLNNSKKNKQRSNGGLITLTGDLGEVSWTREMNNEPRSIDCSLIDCDKSGTKDCLILDSVGQLSCLDGTGHFIYYTSNPKAIKPTRNDLLDFPLILPDLDEDGVNEVMMGSPNGESSTTDIIIISGANGKLILKETQNCSFVHKLQIDTDFVIKYICMVKEDTEQQIFRNLTEIYSHISKKPLDLKKLQPISTISQHKFYGKRPTTLAQTTITNAQDKELVIENKGLWPKDSKVSIKLTSTVNGVKKSHYEYTASKVYATSVPFTLNSSVDGRKNDNLHGFIIKFWIWNGTDENYNIDRTRVKRANEKRDLKAQRSNYTNQTFTTPSSFKTKLFHLTESIVLIAFNSSKMKVENASLSSIVQFCQQTVIQKEKGGEKKSGNDWLCQPDLSYQENSVLIADIDGDGSKELVSYYSTFVNEKPTASSADRWKLKTFIQLFKLESELPNLYADINH